MLEPARRSHRLEPPAELRTGSGLMTVAEFARFLGTSERTVRRLIGSGKLHCVRIGRLVRIDRGEASRWLAARTE